MQPSVRLGVVILFWPQVSFMQSHIFNPAHLSSQFAEKAIKMEAHGAATRNLFCILFRENSISMLAHTDKYEFFSDYRRKKWWILGTFFVSTTKIFAFQPLSQPANKVADSFNIHGLSTEVCSQFISKLIFGFNFWCDKPKVIWYKLF